jgi:hypothetical protein
MRIQRVIGVSFIFLILLCVDVLHAEPVSKLQRTPAFYIQHNGSDNAFRIVNRNVAAAIQIDPADWKGVIRAANDLVDDIQRVSGTKAIVNQTVNLPSKGAILIGTIGKSQIIDRLIATKKISVADIKGKRESSLIQTVGGNLVIAGSDKRGTIYGIL